MMSKPDEPGPSSTRGDAGLSLIECVVALALLSLLMAAAPDALRLAKRAMETSDAVARSTTSRISLDFVRARLSGALPIVERDSRGQTRVAFVGASDSLEFVAPVDGAPGGGGLYRHRLTFETGQRGVDLILTSMLGISADSARGERRIIAAALNGGGFRFHGPGEDPETLGWLTAWTGRGRLPDLVEVRLDGGADGLATPAVIELNLRQRR